MVWEIDLSDKEMDMEVTVNVYLAAISKIKILNTVNSTFASALLSHIGNFKPIYPELCNNKNGIGEGYENIS